MVECNEKAYKSVVNVISRTLSTESFTAEAVGITQKGMPPVSTS